VEELGARVAHVLVGGRGQNEAGVIAPAADGRIRLDAARLAGQVVTVIGVDGRALRLTSSEAANYDDLSAVNIPAVEYPAGISGQGWDTVEERPVAPGTAVLRHDGHELAVQPFAADGSFMFAMTVNLPLNPGRYEVGVQAPGYAPSSRPVEIAGTTTSWRLGRINLAPELVR